MAYAYNWLTTKPIGWFLLVREVISFSEVSTQNEPKMHKYFD